jgi:ATP-dependent DNA helicase DinG
METCLGGKCPDLNKCFITAMRREAARADLIVVNHHLFFADRSIRARGYGEVIPDYGAVIFDEAHMIEDVATQHFGMQVSNYRLDELIRDTRKALPGKSRIKQVGAVAKACDKLEVKSRAFFKAFRSGSAVVRLLPESMNGEMAGSRDGLIACLKELEQRISGFTERSDALTACGRRTSEIGGELHAILNGTDASRVYWREIRGKGVFLHASPIDVAEALKDRVFSEVFSVILTSATLSAGGDFQFIKRRLGLFEADELSLPSPFNLAEQVLLYLPKMSNDPLGAGFTEEAAGEIERILGRTQGRAFVLFTSNQNLHGVHALLADKLGYTILKQGEGTREELIARFRHETDSVLFATRSFWQGIDVPGESLSCVIIDKLPFASPGDPMVSARIEAIKKRGGNPFYEYQIPEAAIALKQGFGRLVRSSKDRGVLSILDRRVTSRSYGKYFLQSLPPCTVTDDAADIAAFFGAVPQR